jgi:hypothetical protein
MITLGKRSLDKYFLHMFGRDRIYRADFCKQIECVENYAL